jgi:hypothetical protein
MNYIFSIYLKAGNGGKYGLSAVMLDSGTLLGEIQCWDRNVFQMNVLPNI